MTSFPLLTKLILPVGAITWAALISSISTPPTEFKKPPIPDSTLSVSINVFNKDSRPTVTIEKQVTIPKGYTYLSHELSLISAFPADGIEQSASWISGPANTWSISAKRRPGNNVPDLILIKATASLGRKNAEIGTQANLSVGLRKVPNSN